MKPVRVKGRYEKIVERASGARLPFVQEDSFDMAPMSPPARRAVRRELPSSSAPVEEGPSEMTQVVFGSLAPSVQPALDWLSTPMGGKVVATGAVALGTLLVTRLLRY